MDGPSINGTSRNVAVIRATPTQTAILKKEFAISDMPTSEKIKALSEQTTLPPKWIHNWFGRQRTKANKSKSKAGQKTYTGTYSLDPTFSTQEVLRIKREHADTNALSRSSPMAESTSVSDYATISMSSSGTLNAPAESEPPRKRRGRPSQKRTSPTRNLRNSKRKDVAIPAIPQSISVKAELIESSASLYLKPIENDPGTRPVLTGIDAGNLTNMVMAYGQLIPSIAPPKRSPMPAPNKATGSRTRNTRSGLSSNHSDSIYARLPTVDVSSEQGASGHDHSTQVRFARTQKPQKAGNPEKFGSSRMLPSILSSSYSMGHSLIGTSVPMPSSNFSDVSLPIAPWTQPPNVTFYNGIIPLAPAFDWENHSPSSGNVVMPLNHRVMSHGALESDQYLAESFDVYQGYNHPYNGQYPGQENMPQNDPIMQLVKPGLTDTMLLNALEDILNPSLAPLKHLIDILRDFKDEQGTYVRLLAYEERDNVTKCLLDENLMQNNPFQAAMALSLLSRLGFEWDY